jgi:SAM-dependent methyltransferase/Ser/Thr protein kinase RdoA (MazF antagonist)
MFGMDLTMERLEFARERFGRDDPVTLIAAGDGRFLPFRDGTFDLVTLSGVLEWIPDDERAWEGGKTKMGRVARMLWSQFGASNPRRTQIEFLREIRRILRPRGQLFVAIENRLGFEYFVGMPDHHSGLRFNSLLPRIVANLYSIARARKPYRTYTYSIPGFTRLFRAAGYADEEFYGLTPGYTHLSEIAPARAKNSIWALPRNSDAPSGVRNAALFVPAYGIVVNKAAGTVSSGLINRLAARIEGETGVGAGAFRLRRWRITGKDKSVLDAQLGDRGVIVRVPHSEQAQEAESRNFQAIGELRGNASLAALVPEPLSQGREQGVSYYVESKMPGTALTGLIERGEDVRALVVEGALLPRRFDSAHAQAAPSVLDGADFDRLVGVPLDRVVRMSGMAAESERVKAAIRCALEGATVMLGRSHGDLTADNVFVDGGAVCAVIDWEEARASGFPLIDAIAFVESTCRVRTPGSSVAETFSSLSEDRRMCTKEEIDALDAAFEAFGTPLRYRRAMVWLAWLHHCDVLLRTPAMYDSNAIERRVVPLFRAGWLDAPSPAAAKGA